MLIGVPLLIGVIPNRYLRNAEETAGSLSLFQRILGGKDARDAWDFLFPSSNHGAWLVVELEGGDAEVPRLVGGKFGRLSAVGQSPSEHNLYVQEMWTVSRTFPRNLVEPLDPRRGVRLPARAIRSIQVLNPPGSDEIGPSRGAPLTSPSACP